MRYLLNSSSRQNIAKATTVIRGRGPTYVVTDATSVCRSTPTNDGSSSSSVLAKTKKWGQQCGVNCGCVVRMELELDRHDRVIRAEYTAKQLLTTTIPIPIMIPHHTTINNNHNNNNPPPSTAPHSIRRPVVTNRTLRFQYVPSKCVTLHALCDQSIRYFLHRPLHQIINCHEYDGARSSPAVRDTILSNLVVTTRHPNKNTNNNYNYITSHRNHCYDLVEDAITALLKGYIPPPRQPSPSPWTDDVIHNNHSDHTYGGDGNHPEARDDTYSTLNFVYNDYHIHKDDDDDVDSDTDDSQRTGSPPWNQPSITTTTPTTTTTSRADGTSSMVSWQERMLHPWWPFTSWTYNRSNSNHTHSDNSENENDQENDDHSTPRTAETSGMEPSPVPKDTVVVSALHSKRMQERLSMMSQQQLHHDRPHWTALDWMDWMEQDREMKQQRQQHWLRLSYNVPTSTEMEEYRVSDWLSYVDALYHHNHHTNHPSSDEQSA